MKKLTFITCLVLLPLALQAQEDRYDQLTNPKLTSINKEAPRSTFTSYATEEDAIVNDRTNGASRLSLNGKWKFNYVENFADRPTDFMNVRTEVNRWPDINVPGNWELQGFGTPIYVNQPYEFCSKGYEPYWDKPNPPYVPKDWNPTGTYRRDFVVGNDWDGKEIFLSADGVRGAAVGILRLCGHAGAGGEDRPGNQQIRHGIFRCVRQPEIQCIRPEAGNTAGQGADLRDFGRKVGLIFPVDSGRSRDTGEGAASHHRRGGLDAETADRPDAAGRGFLAVQRVSDRQSVSVGAQLFDCGAEEFSGRTAGRSRQNSVYAGDDGRLDETLCHDQYLCRNGGDASAFSLSDRFYPAVFLHGDVCSGVPVHRRPPAAEHDARNILEDRNLRRLSGDAVRQLFSGIRPAVPEVRHGIYDRPGDLLAGGCRPDRTGGNGIWREEIR